MKTLTLVLISLITLTSAQAQTVGAIDPAHRFPGYEPTVLENDSQVTTLFNELETGFKGMKPLLLQFGTQCTQRAETWSYQLSATHDIKLQKVFVFYTHAYQDYYYKAHGKAFHWWFHVSPYLLVKGATGQTEERTIDASFSEKPQTMKEWTDIFIESKQACVENIPFGEFEGDVTDSGRSHDPKAHCYIVRAPMYDLFPENIDAREKGQKNSLEWDINEIRYATKALTAGARRRFLARVGL